MAEYVEPEIEAAPSELADEAFADLEERIPGWAPAEGNLDTILIEVFSRLASDTRNLAADVPVAIWRTYGERLLNIQPELATYATVTATFTARDSAGYIAPAGTLVGIRRPDGEYEAFASTLDLAIAAGSTSGSVLLSAERAGAEASGLAAVAGDVVLLDALAWVASVTCAGPTTGGVEGETDDAYFDRLASELRLLSPRPVLAQDFATLAQSNPAVERATAIDRYDPGPPPVSPSERSVTVVMVDAAGEPVSSTVKTEVIADLKAMREVNFQVFAADPTYSTIDVGWQVACNPGFTSAQVDALVDDAVTSYFQPSRWGVPDFGDQQAWRNTTVVRHLEVASLIDRTEGVDYVISYGIALSGGTKATANLTLTGIAPLTRPGAIVQTAPAVEQVA